MAFIMATQPRKKGSAFYTLCSKRSLWGTAGPYIQLPCFCKRGNKKIPLKSHDLRGFCYRSGETRTRGLLLPKQARYQLRNTPAYGGTAAPPRYSISFFVPFVNTAAANSYGRKAAAFSCPVFYQLKERKPLPMISLELTMVMKLCGSFSRRKLRSCKA